MIKTLLLAPQPFYQDRGTPIAVHRLLQALSERQDQVDVITYHEGKDMHYEHVTVHRIPSLPFIHSIRPGFSWKKLLCDILMLYIVLRRVLRKRYQIVYAVEESVFIALLLKWVFKIPYVYDMDSSLSQQIIDRYPRLTPLVFFLEFCEGRAVKHAKAVVPVCDALVDIVEKHTPGKKVVVLQDVSLLEDVGSPDRFNLKAELGIPDLLVLYVGNLEPYQGIDLLLESFALVLKETDRADLVIIGGAASDIQAYRQKAALHLGIHQKVHFLGPKPVACLAGYLAQADVLVSPRVQGKNTPMKLYSYLHSGKATLATDLPTHTQVIDSHVAMLADPSPEAFSKGMLTLMDDTTLRSKLGMAGKTLIEEQYSSTVFHTKLHGLFDWLKMEIEPEDTVEKMPTSSQSGTR